MFISAARFGTNIVILLLHTDIWLLYRICTTCAVALFTRITNCTRLVDFAAVGASMWRRSIYPTRIRCINSNHRTAFVAGVGRSVRGRATVAARQLITPWQIAEPGVLLGNARSASRAVFLPAARLRKRGSFHLPLVDYARRIPRDMLRRRKHASRGNGGLRCLLEALSSVRVNGSPGPFHFRHCRKVYLFAPARVLLGLRVYINILEYWTITLRKIIYCVTLSFTAS